MEKTIVRCPACIQGVLDIDRKEIEIPHFGEVMISTLMCGSCGYRSSDVIPLTARTPKKYKIKVDGPDKLSARVVRSGTSTVIIPELGARIDPGSFSEGFITNVEGVLVRFRDILVQIKKELSHAEQEEAISDRISSFQDLLDRLEGIINGGKFDEPITLVIEDPLGNSVIVSDEENVVLEEPLSDDEVLELMNSDKGPQNE
ncbi:MAG: ZPR1 zinc finger domain-containing protein [Thermoplasmatota archaeon]